MNEKLNPLAQLTSKAEVSKKTGYTEEWEKESLEKLYRGFATLVGPLDHPLIETLTQEARSALVGKEQFSVLEIGAGSGRETGMILNAIAQGRSLLYTGIDVSEEQKKSFIRNENSLPESLKIEDYQINSWQEYVIPKKFDLILAQHCWYGIGRDPAYIKKIVDSLTDNGVAFVTLSSIETISLYAWKVQGDSVFGAEDFEQAATAAGISLQKQIAIGNAFRREDFLAEGRLTQKGIDLCGYLYKKELQGDEPDVIQMLQSAPDTAFEYPRFLFSLRR